jgi:hypothetical protein
LLDKLLAETILVFPLEDTVLVLVVVFPILFLCPLLDVTIPSIYDIDQLTKKNIPAIDYGAHIYATDNKSGFVILNGARRRAGDKLENGIYVERILEDSVVLSYNGIVFSLPSMKSWAGD